MEYNKEFQDNKNALIRVNREEGAKATLLEIREDSEHSEYGDLDNKTVFEVALALIESTGVEPVKNILPLTIESAESNAVHALKRAVELRTEEEQKDEEEKQKVIEFVHDVLGYKTSTPGWQDYNQYYKALKWAEKNRPNGPRIMSQEDAFNADKSVTWKAAGDRNNMVFKHLVDGWHWKSSQYFVWKKYDFPHLGGLDSGYFPMVEVIGE